MDYFQESGICLQDRTQLNSFSNYSPSGERSFVEGEVYIRVYLKISSVTLSGPVAFQLGKFERQATSSTGVNGELRVAFGQSGKFDDWKLACNYSI